MLVYPFGCMFKKKDETKVSINGKNKVLTPWIFLFQKKQAIT